MVDLHKQLKPRQCATIINKVPPALLRVVDSLRHNHAFYRVTPSEFLMNLVKMAAPIVNQKLRFKDSFKVHNIHTKLNKNMYVIIYYVELYVGFLGVLRTFER